MHSTYYLNPLQKKRKCLRSVLLPHRSLRVIDLVLSFNQGAFNQEDGLFQIEKLLPLFPQAFLVKAAALDEVFLENEVGLDAEPGAFQ